MNAVIARILGFAGFGAAFPCASAELTHAVAMKSASAVRTKNRSAVRSCMENLPNSTISLLPALPGSRFYSLQDSLKSLLGWIANFGSCSGRAGWRSSLVTNHESPATFFLHKCGDARDALADHQFVDVVRSLIGGNAFEVVHVPHDAVIVHDAVRAENVARLPGGFQRNRHVVHFQIGRAH